MTSRFSWIYVTALALVFVLLAAVGAGTRGVIAEEVQATLKRHTLVLEARGCDDPVPSPPYERAAPPPPRWFETPSWPIVAYDGTARMWPVLIRSYQSALFSYVGIGLGPLLGGGVAGLRRSTIVLGLSIVLFTALVAKRTTGRHVVVPAAIVALSFGMILSARTGYGFEVGSRAAMIGALFVLSPRGRVGPGRALGAGALSAIAIASRATIAVALAPAALALFAGRHRRPSRAAVALLPLAMFGLPIAAYGIVTSLLPLPRGTSPFAMLPLAALPGRLLAVPRHMVLALAWLGDATSIWGPLSRGETTLGASLWLPAALASVVVVAAAVRAWRSRAGEGEAMLLAALGATAVGGAVLYGASNQFQLALALEPLFALAVGEQIAALSGPAAVALGRPAIVAAVFALTARGVGTAEGMRLDGHTANAMLSGATQRAAIERMRALGLRGPELITTTYNHAGVVEAWTEGAIRPIHAWPLLSTGLDACRLRAAWRAVLRAYRPRYVLLTEAPNLFESRGTDVSAIERELDAVAAADVIRLRYERFPTEAGTPGWALVALDASEARFSSGQDGCTVPCGRSEKKQEPGTPETQFRGAKVGDPVSSCRIEEIRVRTDGISAVIAVDCAPGEHLHFDVRPAGGQPDAPGVAGDLGVYYRNDDARAVPRETLAALASAVAARIEGK